MLLKYMAVLPGQSTLRAVTPAANHLGLAIPSFRTSANCSVCTHLRRAPLSIRVTHACNRLVYSLISYISRRYGVLHACFEGVSVSLSHTRGNHVGHRLLQFLRSIGVQKAPGHFVLPPPHHQILFFWGCPLMSLSRALSVSDARL